MGLFSIFKSKHAGSDEMQHGDQGEYHSRAEEETMAANANASAGNGAGKRKAAARKSKAPDPALPEKKRARRRLIGAVALALAAAIGLPMIFDAEPKLNVDAVDIQIPSKDKTLTDSAASNSAANASNLASPARKEALSDESDPAEEILPATTSLETLKNNADKGASNTTTLTKPKETASSPTAKVEVKPEVQPETKVDTKSESKINPTANQIANKPVNAPAEAQSKALTKSEAKPEVKISSKVDVNDVETARALAILEGRPVTKNNVQENGGKFSLQVAALATQEKVDELRTRLSAEGIQSYTQKVATTTGDKIRVRVGPFASKEEAEKARAKLVRLGLNGTLIPQ
jgi:DedD protein